MELRIRGILRVIWLKLSQLVGLRPIVNRERRGHAALLTLGITLHEVVSTSSLRIVNGKWLLPQRLLLQVSRTLGPDQRRNIRMENVCRRRSSSAKRALLWLQCEIILTNVERIVQCSTIFTVSFLRADTYLDGLLACCLLDIMYVLNPNMSVCFRVCCVFVLNIIIIF